MKVIVAIAGGATMNGSILTEDACRNMAAMDERLEFCESTGNLHAEVDGELGKDILEIPYPSAWMKSDSPREPSFLGDTPEAMQKCLGHLREDKP